jgi:hypothetical protein
VVVVLLLFLGQVLLAAVVVQLMATVLHLQRQTLAADQAAALLELALEMAVLVW